MNSTALGLRVAGTIFGLVCIVQLIRLFSGVAVVVAGYEIPRWASAFVALITGALCVWLWKLGWPHSPHGDDKPSAA